jgi:5-methylcytosine-specific restriction protein A
MARTQGQGNPKWTRDETILALELYFDSHGHLPSPNDGKVKMLSELLRRLPYHSVGDRKDRFRNLAGVAFKLQNLRNVATGEGLGNVSAMDRNVWAEFGSRPEEVRRLATLIRNGAGLAESFEDTSGNEDGEDEFFEGRVVTQNHKRRERNPKIRKSLLASRGKAGGLFCEMCHSASRAIAPGFEEASFEVHHLVPVSVAKERKTKLTDCALLCATCHRLLHRAIALSKRWLNISEAGKIIGIKEFA